MSLFRVLFAGALVTSVGSGMTAFGLAAWMFAATGEATAVGLVTLCAFAPMMLLGPLAGVLADRFDRRLLMVLGDGGSALGLALVLLAVSAPAPSVPLVLLGVTASSVLASLTEPALRATVNELVPPERYVQASGMLQLAASAKFLVSPALAGLVLAVAGLRAILLIDIATVGVTIACTLAVRRALGARPRAAREPSTILADLHEGLRIILARRDVTAAVAIMSCFTLALGTLQVLVKPILLPNHGVGAVGLAETLCATGLLVGAGIVSALRGVRPVPLLTVGIAGSGAAMALAGLRPQLWWVTACCFAVFAFLAACNAGGEVIVRRGIPDAAQGRAWGIIALVSQSGFLIAYVAAGPLADRVLQPLIDRGADATGALPRLLDLGAIVGHGPGRGAAALVTALGLAALLLAPCARLARTRAGDHLEENSRDHAPAAG